MSEYQDHNLIDECGNIFNHSYAAMSELKKENAELTAQLAVCVEFINGVRDDVLYPLSFDEGSKLGETAAGYGGSTVSLLKNLPDSAKKAAEILRFIEVLIGDGSYRIRYTEQELIIDAFKAYKESL